MDPAHRERALEEMMRQMIRDPRLPEHAAEAKEDESRQSKPAPIREHRKHPRRRDSSKPHIVTVYASCRRPCCISPPSISAAKPSIPAHTYLLRTGYQKANLPPSQPVWKTIGTFTDLWVANTTAELACLMAALQAEKDVEMNLPILDEGAIEQLVFDNPYELGQTVEGYLELCVERMDMELEDVVKQYSAEGGVVMRIEFEDFEVMATVERIRNLC